MKIYITILLSLTGLSAFAQQKLDNEAILAAVIDSSSPFYYPGLMMRYEAGDTSLTVEEYYYLYYGFAYQEEYKPLEPIHEEPLLLMIFERNPEPGYADSEEIIKLGMEVLRKDPFSPRNINFMTYAYGVLGDTINERVSADRLVKILAAIESSGTGLKEDSPWHVLWFSHVVDFLGSKGLFPMQRTVVTRSVEYVRLLEPDGNNKGYYFDFGRMYWKQPEVMPEKGSRGMKFKNMEPSYRVR